MNSNLGHSVSSVSSISCLEKPQLHRIGFTLVDWEGVRLHFDFELNDRAVIGLLSTLWSGVGRLWLDLVGFWQDCPVCKNLFLDLWAYFALQLDYWVWMHAWMYAVGDETAQCLSLDIMLTIFALFCYAQHCWLPPPPSPPLCSPLTVWWYVHVELAYVHVHFQARLTDSLMLNT